MRLHSAVMLMILLSVFSSYAQIQLSSIYSRSVSEGYSTQTKVDSLLVETEAGNGCAVTRVTFVLTPGYYGSGKIVVITPKEVDTAVLIEEEIPRTETDYVVLDSIEMQTSFRLPTDFVADSMWLWVDGEKVPAYIQDRSLASAQYTKIVGVRRDPALLETWGRGSYNLRIFPATSMVSRKVMIEFHHLFDDDSVSLATACIPVAYDSLNARYYYGYQSFDKSIGYLKAAFSTNDDRSYSVVFPGVGAGEFTKESPLVLEVENSCKISPATIYTDDKSGDDELLWVGKDGVEDNLNAGISLELSDASMRFENEPDTRVIAIDMRNTTWDWNEYYTLRNKAYNPTSTAVYSSYEVYNVWERARKYAILALKQYVADGQKFNVLIGGKQVHTVFDAPVEATAENMNAAIDAIVAAAASEESSTEAVIAEALEQTDNGIVILISDLFQPYDTYTRTGNSIAISPVGEAYSESMRKITSMMSESGVTMFTICDNSQLTSVALATGGYQLSGVLNRYNIQYEYKVVDGRRITIPELPPLYGSNNNSGIRDLDVSSEMLTDIVFSTDGYYNRYYPVVFNGGFAVNETRGGVTKMQLPNYSFTTLFMRVAGKLPEDYNGSDIPFVISGKMGGLRFVLDVTAEPFSSGNFAETVRENPHWAFTKCEQLSFADYITNADEIKKTGKMYHIVTRQTSLLALEPDMELWEDTAWQQNETNVVTNDAARFGYASQEAGVSDYTGAGSAPTGEIGDGIAFDGISLDDLLYERDISAVAKLKNEINGFAVKTNGSVITITLPQMTKENIMILRLFDLQGRLVMTKNVSGEKIAGTTFNWNIAGRKDIGTGMYTVRIMIGSVKKSFKITLMGR